MQYDTAQAGDGLVIRTIIRLQPQRLNLWLEEVWVIRHAPVDTPEGAADHQAVHEAGARPRNVCGILGDRSMYAIHISAQLLGQRPAVYETHRPGHKEQLAVHLGHQAQIFLHTSNFLDPSVNLMMLNCTSCSTCEGPKQVTAISFLSSIRLMMQANDHTTNQSLPCPMASEYRVSH